MRVDELLQRVQANPDAAPPDWAEIREEMLEAHERAETTEERVALLEVFDALMDLVERSAVAPDELAAFRRTRLTDYRQMVVREAQIGDSICVETLDAVTQREIDAGRMSPDDELRDRVAREMAAPHATRAELMARDAERRAEVSMLPQTQPASRWRRTLKWFQRNRAPGS